MKTLTILLIAGLVAGCVAVPQAKKWDYQASFLRDSRARFIDRFGQEYGKDCKHQTYILAKRMLKAGEEFELAEGYYCGEPHCWIIYKGRILDPTIIGHDKFYKVMEKRSYSLVQLKAWRKRRRF